jgi:hypothetical protein
MCGHCHGEWNSCDWDYCYPSYRGPRRRYYFDEELGPDERRQFLDNEKRALEQRLKEIDARIAETK